jgi:hypothetical protein
MSVALPDANVLIALMWPVHAYLLGLAIHKKGQLVTMDRGMIPLLGSRATETNSISVI